MRLPSFSNYCTNTTQINALLLDLGSICIWYSYRTPVAFKTLEGERVVRKNDWGPTTGKHLNSIDGGDKKSRVSGDVFKDLLRKGLE